MSVLIESACELQSRNALMISRNAWKEGERQREKEWTHFERASRHEDAAINASHQVIRDNWSIAIRARDEIRVQGASSGRF